MFRCKANTMSVTANAAALMLGIVVVIATTIPRHAPDNRGHYGHLLLSLFGLLRRYSTLRQRRVRVSSTISGGLVLST